MLSVIWRFRAKPHKSVEFQQTYSSAGKWAELFGRSPEYRGTVLLQDVSDPLGFVVIDRWASQHAFSQFKEQFGGDYQRLDERCIELTDEETRIGVFQDEVLITPMEAEGDPAL